MIIHCPCCGAPVEITVRLGYARYEPTLQKLVVSVTADDADHTCEPS